MKKRATFKQSKPTKPASKIERPEDAFPDAMTVKQTAQYLRVCTKTVYLRIKAGKIPTLDLGGRGIRVPRAVLDRGIGP